MFYDEAVKNQIKATRDRIEAEKNDKRTYAREKLFPTPLKTDLLAQTEMAVKDF